MGRDDPGARRIQPEWRAGAVAQASLSRPVGPIHPLASQKWGEAGGIVQAPLKRGLSPPKAVTGGFSSPAGAMEGDRRTETLRHGFAVPPPFSREVFRGMVGR